MMNPFIIVCLVKEVLKKDKQVFAPYIDKLVSSLVAINCLFIGNYKLKD